MAKKQEKQKEAPETARPNDVKTLSPQTVIWDIGEKLFEQKPLRIDRLGDVFEEILNIIMGGGQAAILDQLANVRSEAMLPVLMRVLVGVPKKLPKIVSLTLDVPKEEKYIREYIRPRQAIQIIREFIVQNEVAALLQDFFDLAQELRTGIEGATQQLMEIAEEPEEETTKTDDSESEQSGPAASAQM